MTHDEIREHAFLLHGVVTGPVAFARGLRNVLSGGAPRHPAGEVYVPLPLRAPHHSCGEMAAVQEVALAAGGVLLLDEVLEFRPSVFRRILATWRGMDLRFRPVLVCGYTPVGDPHDVNFRRQLVKAQDKRRVEVAFALSAVAPLRLGTYKEMGHETGALEAL
jgi:hypothetical protein